MSWWPRLNAWETSALNLNVWTPAAEAFFTSRIHAISVNDKKNGALRSATDWKKLLRGENRAQSHNLYGHRKAQSVVAFVEGVASSSIQPTR
jgi:hypothetical protein